MIELAADHEEMRAQALGERPFRVNPLYERLAALDQRELMRQLEPGERLSLGYYVAAKRRAEALATPDSEPRRVAPSPPSLTTPRAAEPG